MATATKTALTIGDTNDSGMYVITDTNWNSHREIGSAMRVTVREMMGEQGLSPRDIAAMRRLARKAMPGTGTTRSTRLLRSWYAGGCSHATFLVTR